MSTPKKESKPEIRPEPDHEVPQRVISARFREPIAFGASLLTMTVSGEGGIEVETHPKGVKVTLTLRDGKIRRFVAPFAQIAYFEVAE